MKKIKNRKPTEPLERLVIQLDFSSQSKIDYEFVNRKWEKYLIK
jgi:hypothetical protein